MRAATPYRNVPIVVVTGAHDVGKSFFCMRIVRAALRRGLTVGGLITHKLIVEGEEVRYVEDVASHEYRTLYRCDPEAEPNDRRPEPETVSWVEAVLERAVDADLLVLDELGPRELYRGDGWATGLDVLERRGEHPSLVVVQDGLLRRFYDALPPDRAALLDFSPDSRDAALRAMLAWLREAAGPDDIPGDAESARHRAALHAVPAPDPDSLAG